MLYITYKELKLYGISRCLFLSEKLYITYKELKQIVKSIFSIKIPYITYKELKLIFWYTS